MMHTYMLSFWYLKALFVIQDIFPNKFWKFQVARGNLFYHEIQPLSSLRLTIMSLKDKKVQGESYHYRGFVTQMNILIKWCH